MTRKAQEKHNSSSTTRTKTGLSLTQIVLFSFVCFLLSAFYLRFAWNRYSYIASSEAMMLAQSIESMLLTEHVSQLSGSPEDIETPQYEMTKSTLSKLVETTNPVRFAYIMAEKNGKIIFLLDSEPPDSPDYSPPGQVYEEAGDIDWVPFKSGKAVLTGQTTDRWGTWVSAFVPINDPVEGNVIAVLGLDYSADEWIANIRKRMIPDLIIVITLSILFLVLLRTWHQHSILKALSKKMAFNETLYRSIFEQAPIGIAIADNYAYVTHSMYGQLNANPMFEKILGRTSNELVGKNWADITYGEDLKINAEKFEQFKEGIIEGYVLEKRFIKPDGSTIWTKMNVSRLLGDPSLRPLHLCLVEDISHRKETENFLKESERSKSVLLSHLPGMAYRCRYDREWTMEYVSGGCFNLTGYVPESLLYNRDLSYNDVISPEYREILWEEWERILPQHKHFKYEYEITTFEGKRKWVLELAEGIYGSDGKVESLEGIIIDISDKKEIEEILRYNNDHERWTGLFNRYYLENMLAMDSAVQNGEKRAVISINLSPLSSLTTTYGVHYTQEIIKRTVDALSDHCNDKSHLFHTYENRFVFYVKGYEDKNELLNFCDDVKSTLEPMLISERVSGGVGIFEIEGDAGNDPDNLLKKLLIASERAIGAFDSNLGFCFYNEEMEKEIIREQEIKEELAGIAKDEENSELFLQFQPILDLRSGHACGFEALARIRSKKLGLISPLEFIPIAEKTKLILPVGEKIILKAIDFLNSLKETGHENLSISINISAIQILSANFAANLCHIINEKNICPANIALEITESVFASNFEDINRILEELSSLGIRISIDDFGTEYSSLARESELNVHCLKIDKIFIDKLLTVDRDKSITGDIISMAHRMGHVVIAEGVEEEKQIDYLKDHCCDKIQGYFVSRPLDVDKAIEFIKDRPNEDICSSNQYFGGDCDNGPGKSIC